MTFFFYLFRMVIFHKVKYILQLNYLSEREYDRKGGGTANRVKCRKQNRK